MSIPSTPHALLWVGTLYFSSTEKGIQMKVRIKFSYPSSIPHLPPTLICCSLPRAQAPCCSVNSFPTVSPLLQNDPSTPRLIDVCYCHPCCALTAPTTCRWGGPRAAAQGRAPGTQCLQQLGLSRFVHVPNRRESLQRVQCDFSLRGGGWGVIRALSFKEIVKNLNPL